MTVTIIGDTYQHLEEVRLQQAAPVLVLFLAVDLLQEVLQKEGMGFEGRNMVAAWGV